MLLVMNTSVWLTWIVHMVSLPSRLSIRSTDLLGVCPILACPDSSWTSACSSCATTRLIDPNEFVDEIVKALLIIALWELLVAIVIKILMQDLLEILMQLFSALILREMLLIIFDQFLYLLLELLL